MVHRKEREIQFELSQRTNVINFFIITSSVKRGLLISDLTVIKTGGGNLGDKLVHGPPEICLARADHRGDVSSKFFQST